VSLTNNDDLHEGLATSC